MLTVQKMNFNNYQSFSDYLDDLNKQKQNAQIQGKPQAYPQRTQVVVDPTDQSKAREALAKEQELASRKAEQETKMQHYRISGRYVLANEAVSQQKQQKPTRPADPNRIAYIQQLRKELKLVKR